MDQKKRKKLWSAEKMFETVLIAAPMMDISREWVLTFVRWYNHRHHHSGIKFVTPNARHSGSGVYQARVVFPD